VILVKKVQDNVNANLAMVVNIVTCAKMDSSIIRLVFHASAIFTELLMKFVTNYQDLVCAKKDMVVHDVINVCLDILDSPIVFLAIVQQLEVFKKFVITLESVHV
jgi:hypothetical protein